MLHSPIKGLSVSTKLIAPKRRVSSETLTIKERVFVAEYPADNEFNATRAAERAGYSSPANAGSKLLAKVKIQRAIGVELRKRLENNEITAARVLKELARIGLNNPRELFDSDNKLRNVRDMPEDMQRCIAGVEVKQVKVRRAKDAEGEDILIETSIVKVKLWPKTNALELIAKHLGMLDERFKVTHGIDPAAQAVLKSLLEKLESQPTQVIDTKYIEQAASKLPDMTSRSDMRDDELGEVIDGKVDRP